MNMIYLIHCYGNIHMTGILGILFMLLVP